MKLASLAALILPFGLAAAPARPLAAQQPTQAVVEAAMQQPGAAEAIRARLQASGMSPDQVRAKLRAAGYSESLLDGYLTTTPTAGAAAATPEAIAAMNALGVASAADVLPGPAAATGAPQAGGGGDSQIFGVDVFRRGGEAFPQPTSGPVPPDYRLGPGDQLVLILTGDVELTHTLSVTAEGFVLIPQVGQVYLANLTMTQAKSLLTTRLGRVYSGVRRGGTGTTNFDLVVGNVRAVQVFVLGEVRTPGAYPMSALGTIISALYAAGGPTDDANMRDVVVRRLGEEVARFDLFDYVLRGDTKSDLRLDNGDVVFVGVRSKRVKLTGAVRHQALFDLRAEETLTDLVAHAGGLTANAALSRISIARIIPAAQRTGPGPQRVTIDIPVPAGSGAIPPFPLEDADEITIFSLTDAERNYVEINGSVFFPGKFGMENGLTLSRLVARAGGMMTGTFAGRAHISRLNPVDQTRRLIAVSLPADSLAPWPDDLAIEDRDIVTIYNRLAMRPERTVSIVGAVNDPKSVPYRDGMTLRDLVLAAQGLAPGAWLDSAEIGRLPDDRVPGQLAQTIRVPLDSTYIFDRDSLGRPFLPPGSDFRASGAADVPLAPWDRVLILSQPEFEYQRSVVVIGEIRFPGTYSLRRKDERLTDILSRAGGLTERAYADGIQFLRGAGEIGRIDIDLADAQKHPQGRNNLILQPGDTVRIPEFQPSVRVVGAVNSPGSVLWQKGRSIGDYVNAAGGFASNADDKRASVRQPNGEIETRGDGFLWFDGRDPSPGPGSEVKVPALPPEEYHDKTAIYAAIASMIASTATIIIALTK